MKREGKIKSTHASLKKTGDLAELIGTILGDGHIMHHDRCDALRIVGDAKKMGFVNRSAMLIEKVFGKRPSIIKRNASNAVNITLYEKNIQKRLNLPAGSRTNYEFQLPGWIAKSKPRTIRFLRGLYEAEGSLSHHEATYTHKLIFANTNQHLLTLVARLVRGLGFTVNIDAVKVQISRKVEVQKFADLIEFRHYET